MEEAPAGCPAVAPTFTLSGQPLFLPQ
eukprot:COSAG03_NODE_19372_length_338_cov_0.640167_1_plen_26_part_01